jgi:opacity protein-like surface antigen
MKNFVLLALLTLVVAGVAAAGDNPIAAPEISPSGIAGALGLVAGGLLVMRSRRK